MLADNRNLIAALIVLGLLLLWSLKVNKELPRGIRNNNPGNIEKGTAWNGMASNQPDSRYITFKSPEYGIRAMARILRTYREKHGLTSVFQIINRWAPPTENPTQKYIEFVAKRLGVSPTEALAFTDGEVGNLIAAIIKFENGVQPYDRETLLRGVEMERTA